MIVIKLNNWNRMDTKHTQHVKQTKKTTKSCTCMLVFWGPFREDISQHLLMACSRRWCNLLLSCQPCYFFQEYCWHSAPIRCLHFSEMWWLQLVVCADFPSGHCQCRNQFHDLLCTLSTKGNTVCWCQFCLVSHMELFLHFFIMKHQHSMEAIAGYSHHDFQPTCWKSGITGGKIPEHHVIQTWGKKMKNWHCLKQLEE